MEQEKSLLEFIFEPFVYFNIPWLDSWYAYINTNICVLIFQYTGCSKILMIFKIGLQENGDRY